MAEPIENVGERNLDIVERAKKAYADGHYKKAIELFEQSIEICESQNWTDGVRYAKGMIEDAQEMIKLQEEEQQFLAHEHEQEEEEKQILHEIPQEEGEVELRSEPSEPSEPSAPIAPSAPQTASEPSAVSESESEPESRSEPPQMETAQAPDPQEIVSILLQKDAGRLTCPKCGNNKRNMIREVVDKSHIIMDYPLIYGKKYICGKCGSHWRRVEE